jgi:purine-binding chemotaxis protein CheW
VSPAAPSPAGFAALHARLDAVERSLSAEVGQAPEARAAILEARARALATARTEESSDALEVLAFAVGGERFAVRLSDVEQVVEAASLVHLPGAPRAVLGALNVGGSVVVVLDPRQLLRLPGMSDLTRVIVVRDARGTFGIAVEAVEGRVAVPTSACAPKVDGPFSAITPERLAVLDLARLVEPGAGPTPRR